MSFRDVLVQSFQEVEQISVDGGGDQSFWDRLLESLERAGATIGEYAPKVLGALIILIIGWFIIRILKRLTFRLLNSRPVKVVLD